MTSYYSPPFFSDSLSYLPALRVNNRSEASNTRMSVFGQLAPLIPQASAPCKRTNENLKVCASPPHSLSSPVIKKKTIQILSFDEKGIMMEKYNTKHTDSASKTSSQPLWGYQGSQREKASTLPRAKPRTYSSQALSAKSSISISPAPKPNSSPTLLLSRPKPSDSLYPTASQLSEPSLLIPDPEQKLRVSPTLIVPAPRLSPSPTSVCQEMSADGARQPSPVAKERRAKTIHISNTHMKPLNTTKHDILDQHALVDFTHPVLGRLPPAMSQEARHQTLPQSHKPPTTLQNVCSLQSTFGSSKKEKPKIATRNAGITVIPKPKSNIKQLQGFQPSESTHIQTSVSESEGIKCFIAAHRESHSAFHRLPTQSSLQTKCTDDSQKSNYVQKSDFTSSHQSFEQIYSKNRATVTPKTSFSSEPRFCKTVVSPNIESRRRQLHFSNETRVDTACLSGSHHNRPQEGKNIKSSEKYRLLLKTQGQSATTDIRTAVCQSDCVSKDYSCQSRGIDPEVEATRCAYRVHGFNTCQVAPQTQEASCPAAAAAAECTTSLSRPISKTDLQSKTRLSDQDQPLHTVKTHKGVKVGNMGLNHPHISAPADGRRMPTELPEHPCGKCATSWAPCVMHCPLNTSSSGSGSNWVFGSPSQAQHRVYQRQEETKTTPLPTNQLKNSAGEKAFIKEDEEDPYYVTMYYPGSVYVDMSDIVPPEVRPKPAVPAKPPNVGVPSPSSPFAPQVPGIGGSGGSAPPPSAIPVPIGSHGASHVGSHALGHGVGHGVGHTAAHTAAHGGGHGHSGSHASTGGSTLLGYIGIDTIIEQMRKKTMKTGFDFNIMVVGHSGLGKSTLMNTLFKSQVSRRSAGWARDDKIPKTVELKSVSHVIEEGGVKMKLTVVDTPGFGDQINNDNCWEPISKYINEQYEKFLKEEVNITRKKRIPDTRMHCCLYFISPTGHSLRQLDLEFMKRLSHSVNIIPIIAKADTMTIEERQEFKQRVRKELEMSGIEFYPQKEFDDDMEDKSDNDKIREMMPFAVVGSDKEYQVNGKRVLGRKTAWGIVEVENPNHCEFAQLRDFLIRSHLQDLKEVTHNIHYETYRAKRLNENGGLHPISSNDTQESNL